MIGAGVPERWIKTGPVSRVSGDVVGRGTGDAVALPVGRGVGAMMLCGPIGGTGGIGMSDGEALGVGLGDALVAGDADVVVAGSAETAALGDWSGVGVGTAVAIASVSRMRSSR